MASTPYLQARAHIYTYNTRAPPRTFSKKLIRASLSPTRGVIGVPSLSLSIYTLTWPEYVQPSNRVLPPERRPCCTVHPAAQVVLPSSFFLMLVSLLFISTWRLVVSLNLSRTIYAYGLCLCNVVRGLMEFIGV